MKKFNIIAAVALMIAVGSALAGSVYDRATKALSASAGTGTWTNTVQYSALNLKRIWIESSLNATSVVTVTRITSDGAYTQAVGSVTCTSSAGSTASFTAAYLKYGDMLYFSSSPGTGATAIVEYEVQQH